MTAKFSVGDQLQELRLVLSENAVLAMGVIVALTGLNVALDQFASDRGGMALGGIASLVAQYFVVIKALDRRGWRESSGRFGGFWGLGVVSGLATLLGLVLLIVPGLVLAARWVAADAILLAEDTTVSDALGESWRRTAPSMWSIIGAILIIYVPVGILGFGAAMGLMTIYPVVGQAILDLALVCATVAGWLLGIAVYGLVREDRSLAEVFA